MMGELVPICLAFVLWLVVVVGMWIGLTGAGS